MPPQEVVRGTWPDRPHRQTSAVASTETMRRQPATLVTPSLGWHEPLARRFESSARAMMAATCEFLLELCAVHGCRRPDGCGRALVAHARHSEHRTAPRDPDGRRCDRARGEHAWCHGRTRECDRTLPPDCSGRTHTRDVLGPGHRTADADARTCHAHGAADRHASTDRHACGDRRANAEHGSRTTRGQATTHSSADAAARSCAAPDQRTTTASTSSSR